MEPKSNLQHVQLPKKKESDSITPQDQLVYVSIRRYMNKDTYEAFPSLETIGKHCGASEPTVRKCIKNLVKNDYLTVRKEGRKNIYEFNKLKAFEPFSYEFLDKEDLSFMEKSYILSTQQYMFKHPETQTGTTSLSTRELESKIGISHSSIIRCQHSLADKNYLDIVKTSAKEIETGCCKNAQIFHLDTLGQAVVFTLMDHEDKINENSEDIYELKQTIKEMKKEMQDIQKAYNIVIHENRELKKKDPQKSIIID